MSRVNNLITDQAMRIFTEVDATEVDATEIRIRELCGILEDAYKDSRVTYSNIMDHYASNLLMIGTKECYALAFNILVDFNPLFDRYRVYIGKELLIRKEYRMEDIMKKALLREHGDPDYATFMTIMKINIRALMWYFQNSDMDCTRYHQLKMDHIIILAKHRSMYHYHINLLNSPPYGMEIAAEFIISTTYKFYSSSVINLLFSLLDIRLLIDEEDIYNKHPNYDHTLVLREIGKRDNLAIEFTTICDNLTMGEIEAAITIKKDTIIIEREARKAAAAEDAKKKATAAEDLEATDAKKEATAAEDGKKEDAKDAVATDAKKEDAEKEDAEKEDVEKKEKEKKKKLKKEREREKKENKKAAAKEAAAKVAEEKAEEEKAEEEKAEEEKAEKKRKINILKHGEKVIIEPSEFSTPCKFQVQLYNKNPIKKVSWLIHPENAIVCQPLSDVIIKDKDEDDINSKFLYSLALDSTKYINMIVDDISYVKIYKIEIQKKCTTYYNKEDSWIPIYILVLYKQHIGVLLDSEHCEYEAIGGFFMHRLKSLAIV